MAAEIGEVGDSPVPCSEHELALCDKQDRRQTGGSVIPRDSLIIRIRYQAGSSVVDKKQEAAMDVSRESEWRESGKLGQECGSDEKLGEK